MEILSKEELVEYVNHGNKVKYVFFWGHQKPKSGVSKTCFSQWYESEFEIDGIKYKTAEHYMMAEKARLFGDTEIESKIVQALEPGEVKRLGRAVSNFDEEIWEDKRFEIVVCGNMAKFGQSHELQQYLFNTEDRVLVEASPVDNIWGIGLAVDDPRAENPNSWRGINLLGFALMEVRNRLIRENN
jgi:ribA/ribD-fused uncharacterized protein